MLIALYTANAYSAEREISASVCTRSVPGFLLSMSVTTLGVFCPFDA